MAKQARERELQVFPAPAGINRVFDVGFFLKASVPRASGDKPLPGPFVSTMTKCSPRQRG
ncbi:hypothetical protein C4760_07205 [Salmonella enterica subsp. enterica serovar Infantis]|uniref:hypothetical protein n=1 Tax=Salmonella enterica TaxID=28901 RepID=UPI0003F5DE76|nr:hypothetical protein [Salmonella enterica]ECF1147286.1 hypothetical protein [Salmonella enterica subsp. enterica serovar Infantis]MBJ5666026.1 hypothetical protein [Salmonella enterica subsp. enterica serovar Derby]PYH04059.1 hypothetical protein DM464_17760 [Salmonella enterica subsp. enterica]ECT9923005.1 hypothetical protein [Salmonella enterica]